MRIIDGKITNTCEDCQNFIGCGDWSLCCKIKPDLVYENTPACEKFVRKQHGR